MARVKVEDLARRAQIKQLVVWTLILVSLVAWREGVYYAGGIDPVVLAKGALSISALLLAWSGISAGPCRSWLGPRTVVLVVIYEVVAVLGAWASGTVIASGVLSVRVLVLLVTVALLVLSHPPNELLSTLLLSSAGVGTVLALSGLGTLNEGRLSGGVLPTNPNEIALLLGPPALALLWRIMAGKSGPGAIVGLIFLATLTFLTGSRTGLLALVVAALIIVVMARRLRLPAFAALVLGIPGMFYVAFFTPVLSGYFGRGGVKNLTTLNSRTTAWQAALTADRDFFGHWFGEGLAVKTVEVKGTYWDNQVLDSTWLSSFVQVGVVGVVVLALFVFSTFWAAGSIRTTVGNAQSLWIAIVTYAVIRSLLETGLLDAYALFLFILFPSLVLDLRGRNSIRTIPISGATAAMSSPAGAGAARH